MESINQVPYQELPPPRTLQQDQVVIVYPIPQETLDQEGDASPQEISEEQTSGSQDMIILRRIKWARICLLIISCTYIVLSLDELLMGDYLFFFISAFAGISGIISFKNVVQCPIICFCLILWCIIVLEISDCVLYYSEPGPIIFTTVLWILYAFGISLGIMLLVYLRKMGATGHEILRRELSNR